VVKETDLGIDAVAMSELVAKIGSLLMLRARVTVTGDEAEELPTVTLPPFRNKTSCCGNLYQGYANIIVFLVRLPLSWC